MVVRTVVIIRSEAGQCKRYAFNILRPSGRTITMACLKIQDFVGVPLNVDAGFSQTLFTLSTELDQYCW